MADELAFSAGRVVFTEDGVDHVIVLPDELTVDVAGTEYAKPFVQIVGFAAQEALQLLDVTKGGWVFLFNLDATNFISVYPDNAGSTTPLIQLKPGDPWQRFRLSPSAGGPYVQADTGNCRMLVALVDL